MPYQLLLLDVDNTLRPAGQELVPVQNVRAVKALQKAGVKIAIATGRGRSSVSMKMLSGIHPDYWICSAGAEILDAEGNMLWDSRLTNEEMYALVDFFEDYELPLRFLFGDASYAYLGYEKFKVQEKADNIDNHIVDGEDQDRHLIDMPFGVFGYIPRELAGKFQEKYGYLNLEFVYSKGDGCDILRPGQDKATGLQKLCQAVQIPIENTVAIGDGDNDAGMLQAAGIGVCMADGAETAKAAADWITLSAAECGVAAAAKKFWPEVFA